MKRGFLVLLALPLFFLAAQTFAGGKKEAAKEINVYTILEDDILPKYLEVFKKQNPGIELNLVRDSTGVITAKLLAEKENPQADVIWGLAVSSLLILEKEGMLEPYAPKGLERILPQFRDEANPPRWVGNDAWETAFVVNTIESEKKKMPVPKSYEDLVKPVYRGAITMPNPASSGTGYLTVSAVLQLMGEKKGWEYLDRLHENVALYTHSGSSPAKKAGSGEFPVGVSFGFRGITQKKRGEPVTTIFPAEGSGWDLEANSLMKKKTIKPEAKQFLDWAIGDEIMKEYAKNYAIITVKTSNPPPEGYPADPLKQLIKNDFRWAAANRDRILAEWTKRYDAKSEAKK